MEPEQAPSPAPHQQHTSPPDPAVPEAFTPHTESPASGSTDAYATPGWSWGAFMSGPMFLIATRKYVYLWLYLFALIPGAIFIIMIWLGVKGREMAAESTTFTSREQYVGYMKAIDHAGKVWFFFVLALVGLWLLVFITVIGSAITGGSSSVEREYGTMEYEEAYGWGPDEY